MTEIDIFLTGIVGGFAGGIFMSWFLIGHMKFCYDEKIKILQCQLAAIRAQLSSDFNNDRS